VLIVDIVVTAGTAKRDAIDKIRKEGGITVGNVVALGCMEKLPALNGDDSIPMLSAIGEIRNEYGIPVRSILTLNDIIMGLKGRSRMRILARWKNTVKHKVSDWTKRYTFSFQVNTSVLYRVDSNVHILSPIMYATSTRVKVEVWGITKIKNQKFNPLAVCSSWL
jgi:hypothetical protein